MAAPGHHSQGPERVEFDARCAESDSWPACGDKYMHCVMFVGMCVYVCCSLGC